MKLPISAHLITALAVLTLSFPCVAIAQSIASLESSLSKKESALVTLENRIESYAQRQLDAEEKLQQALEDLGAATAELDEAKQSTSPEAATQQSLATKKVELAKNALESRQSRLNSAREKYTSLLVDKQRTEAEITALEAVIAERRRVAEARATAAQEAARLAEQRAAEEKFAANTQAPTPAITQPKIAAKTVAPKTTEPKIEAPQQDTALPEASEDAQPTPRQLHAQKMMAELNERVKGADKEGWRRYETLTLKVNREEPIEFEYLGNHQYYAEVQLEDGKQKIKIRSRTFVINVPKDESGDTFVVIYDTRDKYKADFSIFNKSLLD